MNVRLTADQKVKILNSTDIYKVMQQVLLRENKIRRNQEHFWVIGLNTQNEVLFIELVSLGAANRVNIAPPEVFRMGIYKLAVKMVLIHNHPAGTLKPSKADKDFTTRMIKSGILLLIDVIDHLIITEKTFFSFNDNDIMEELKESPLYDLVDNERAGLLELKIEAGRGRERRMIAKKMKAGGISIEVIRKMTGLKKAEIENL